MQNRDDTLTYKQELSKKEAIQVAKAVGLPLAVFGLAMFTIQNFANFGSKLLCPLIAAMWIVGFIVGIIMPAQRQEIVNQTLAMIAMYCGAMLGLKMLLAVVSGASSEMIAASYDQAIPMSTGNAIPGYLQTMMWFVALLMPIGDIGMQVKRLKDFKHNQNLQKTFGQVRGMRNSGKNNTRSVR